MSTTTRSPFANLIVWLDDHEVPYELHEHPIAYTAEATAHAEGVDPRTFAKSVGIRSSEGSTVLAVVDATDEVDLARLAAFLDVSWVAVLSEEELATILPDCEVGTIPPVPELAGVAVYADEAVRSGDEISFHAGSHRVAVRVGREAWERAAGIRYGAFARPKH